MDGNKYTYARVAAPTLDLVYLVKNDETGAVGPYRYAVRPPAVGRPNPGAPLSRATMLPGKIFPAGLVSAVLPNDDGVVRPYVREKDEAWTGVLSDLTQAVLSGQTKQQLLSPMVRPNLVPAEGQWTIQLQCRGSGCAERRLDTDRHSFELFMLCLVVDKTS